MPVGTGSTGASPFDPFPLRLQWLLIYDRLAMIAAIAVSMLACYWLFCHLRHVRKSSRDGLLRLHRDRCASASMEFLLVFFPLLILVLAVWQLAFMLNAQMHVGYAAYAAARSASTVAFIDLPDEPEGVLLNGDEPNAQKWQRIERSAIPGTLAISPGNAEAAVGAYFSSHADALVDGATAPDFDSLDLGALPGQVVILTVHAGNDILEGNRISRAAVKALYAQSATRVLINGRDAKGNQVDGGKANNAFDLSGSEVLNVTVEYDFWLNVPYAGQMMRLAFGGNALMDNVTHPTLTLRETVAINTWPQVSAY